LSEAEQRIEGLARDLVVEEGFSPLERTLPAAGWASGLFHACLVRMDSDNLYVHAFLAWRGQDGDELARRAESLRQALAVVAQGTSQRVCATVFVVAQSQAELGQAEAALGQIQEGHFLQRILVAHAVVALGSGAVHFHGRVAPRPNLDWFEQHVVSPSLHDAREADATIRRQDIEESRTRSLLAKGDAWATWTLIALNVAAYLAVYYVASSLQAQLGSGSDSQQSQDLALQVLGANEHALVFGKGEWWRLGACMFLHAGELHLLLNMVTLFSLGSLVERLVGPLKFLVIYFTAGLGGSLLSAVNPDNVMSVGASGALLGLAGALLALHFRRPPGFPEQLASRIFGSLLWPVILTFALGLGLSFMGGPIRLDNWAHFGGLFTGLALALAWPSLLQKPLRNRA
jgi:membrane associated rhomboid family serine protease